MLDLASRLGAARLVTGHYARVHDDAHIEDRADRCGESFSAVVADGARPDKDQSYVLAGLAPRLAGAPALPAGRDAKDEVREIAAEAGLAVARKPDSQDLCFLAGTRQPRFLERHGGGRGRPGADRGSRGASLGRHRGAQAFTVGQRHGLGLGGREPLYVLRPIRRPTLSRWARVRTC